ncbi:Fanconi anemia group A protein-like [Littorina saxatilis]|uniref:Fanconi anemia group A protein-like n=1 Tax=Littorina saxatilis TaxID=31220 RepID=UPI0038B5E6AA
MNGVLKWGKFTEVLNTVCSHLVKTGFPEKKPEDTLLRKVCVGILDGVTRGLLDSQVSDREVLLHTDLVGVNADVSHVCFKKFCTHTISLIMSHRSNMKVSEALKRQTEWKSGKVADNLKTLYKQLLVPFESSEVVELLRRILEKQEVNWQMLLSFLATFLVCFPSAATDIQDHVTRLMTDSLENADMENTIIAFLFARQSCVEGAHVFPTYPQWFQALPQEMGVDNKFLFSSFVQQVFGDGSQSPAGSKKAFTFLIKFLTDLVPFEPADVLKVHILRPPFIPAKCRDLWTDYTLLAKTRLADLKVPLEETNASIYSDQGNSSAQGAPGLQDVEKAIAGFESSGKLPTNVMEASIFRKPYFVGKFLPALLQPRHLPDVADSRMKFIEALKKAGKIPSSLVTKYEEACRKETRQLLEGVFEVEEDDGVEEMMMEPLEQLQHRLKQLADAVVSASTKARVAELVSVVSEKIEGVVGTSKDGAECSERECMVDLCQPDLISSHIQVVDEVLNSVCLILHSLKDASRQSWLHQLVRMLSQHYSLLPAFLVRLVALFRNQQRTLSAHHVKGAAAFMFHLGNNSSLFPLLFIRQHRSKGKLPITLLSCFLSSLLVGTAQQMTVAHQFLAAYLKVAFLCESEKSWASEQNMILPSQLIVMFCILSWRLIPETQPSLPITSQQQLWQHLTREMHSTKYETDGRGTEDAALALYASEKFQELLKTQRPTLEDWVDFELGVVPAQDCLSPLQRHTYQFSMMSHFCSAVSSGKLDPSQCKNVNTDLHQCCSVLMKKLAMALSRFQTESGRCPGCQQTAHSDITETRVNQEAASGLLSLLAKLVQNFPSTDDGNSSGRADTLWLVQQVFSLNAPSADSPPTCLPQALLRVVLCCPAYLLFTNSMSDGGNQTLVKDTVRFMEKFLVMHASEGGVLALDVICHLLQGYVTAAEQCSERSMMKGFEDHPLIVLSTLVHLSSVRVLVPSLFVNASSWNTLPPLLDVFDRFFQEGTLSVRQTSCDSFSLAAAVLAVIKHRGLMCDTERRKDMVRQLDHSQPKVVAILCELLLVSLSDAQSCCHHSPNGVKTSQLWLSEIWRQFPHLIPCAGDGRSEFASFRHSLLPADSLPFVEVAILRCMGQLAPETIAAEKGVVEMGVCLFSRLCQRFEDTHSSQQMKDVGVLLELSRTVVSLVRLAPLSLLQCVDGDTIKQCGLEMLAVYHQRMKART